VIRVNCLAERKEKLVAIVFELQINQWKAGRFGFFKIEVYRPHETAFGQI
jgi:hypothetical protein